MSAPSRAAARTPGGPRVHPGARTGVPAVRALPLSALPFRALPLLVLALAVAALSALTAPTAHAEADGGFRYWSFWLQQDSGDDTWSYATEGPATQRPEDGDTLGFRFAVSKDSKNAKKPRGGTSFAAACTDTPKKSGTKRVALRLDFGTGADAPKGGGGARDTPPEPRTECARVDENASAAETLAAVAEPLRYSSDSLLCAVDDYPAKGCGEQVADSGEGNEGGEKESSGAAKGDGSHGGDDSTGSSTAEDGGGTMSTGLGLTAGIAAVAVLGAAALWQARRRRQ